MLRRHSGVSRIELAGLDDTGVVAFMEARTVTGPAKNLLRFCRLVRERGEGRWRVSVATFVRAADPSAELSNDFIRAVQEADVDIDVIRERGRFDLGTIPQMRRIFEKLQPSILQTHGIKSHFLASLARPGRARWIAYHHGYTSEDLKMRMYNQANRFVLPRADRVITVCEAFAVALTRAGVRRERIRVLPNAVDPDTQGSEENASQLKRRLELPADGSIILAVGRLSPEKGHRDLFEAMLRIRRRTPNSKWQLIVVGDGPRRAALLEQARNSGLDGFVRFVGHQSDVRPFFRIASVFVLPSRSEGSPNVLLEAMAAGAPVVACSVGGVPEMVRHGETAILVPPRDPEALANAIIQVLGDSELAAKLVANAANDVRTRYSPQNFCDSLLGIYDELRKST